MSDLYYSLSEAEEIEKSSQFVIPRASAINEACDRSGDFHIRQLFKQANGETIVKEWIVVDVECDGVPPNNPSGIRYRERIALGIPENPNSLVEVLALRKDFPILMHQNSSKNNEPVSLCLYFEPAQSVLRTWTPIGFLKRIQWWLEKTARNELHAADQPVERLFFSTLYELVLPWNFDDLVQDPNQTFIIQQPNERRSDGSVSFFVLPATKESPKKTGVAPIQITLDPVEHGHLERIPDTLGELDDILSNRGANLISALKDAVQGRVDSNGISAELDEPFSVVLLNVPVCRNLGDPPEMTSRQAYLVLAGFLELGEKINALYLLDKKYYKESSGIFAPTPKMDWREQLIFPMETINFNSKAAARAQSGIKEKGPDAVLVGAGSLGSTMLNFWCRSGWGNWTVIDRDHIKPHNLVRHTAFAQHVGITKAKVVAGLNASIMCGASEVVPICADVTELDNLSTVRILIDADLVIDASTTLEYPRQVSGRDDVCRHMTVFITPNGKDAVLYVEDKSRTIRLRTLEAQYYRAVIREEWGVKHLDGNLGTYWSGASCRDISTVLPYSRIASHAATLAEQVQLASANPEALIRVWSRDLESGGVIMHKINTCPERKICFGDLDLFIDYGIEQELRSQRAQHAPLETGGVLVGYYDFNIRAVVVVDALPAPQDSELNTTSFERGTVNLLKKMNDISKRTGGIVQYIGEWHSHPPGYSAAPSNDDIYQLIYLGMGMSQDGLPAVSLIIGENDMQIMKCALGG